MSAQPIQLSIRALAEFLYRRGSIDSRFSGLNRAQQGSRLHRKLQRQAGADYRAEVPLSIELSDPPFAYILSGRADGLVEREEGLLVDEIKSTGADLDTLQEDHNPAHWAQGMLYAHILCRQRSLSGCTVQLTYINVDTEDLRRFQRDFSAEDLEAFMDEILQKYRPWAQLASDWQSNRDDSLRALSFPFPAYREGQRTLAVAAYTCFRDEEILFACAPTGIGKTLSTLFPALKALGEGCGRRIFYLTAKTSTRAAAQDAVSLLARHAAVQSSGNEADKRALALKSLTLTAKDKICFQSERACYPERCPYADGYYDRLNDALYAILCEVQVFDRPAVEEAARKYSLCPYELSLDLSLWCDLIICDYNYLFDPVVHLQRFFEGSSGDHLFLVDEAHNLVDRSREMHSATLSKGDFFAFKKALPKSYTRLHKALSALNSAFISLRKQCQEEGAQKLSQRELPSELESPLARFAGAAEAFLEKHRGSDWEDDLLALYFAALFYQRIAEGYSEAYQTLITCRGSDVTVKLFCLDASAFLAESLAKGRASVLFSATLRPLPYYRRTLGGGEESLLLDLPSPFPQENLGLFLADSVSTRYVHRAQSMESVAHLLGAMVNSRPGNYIAYFPSYAYMQEVYALFISLYPEQPTLLQRPAMAEEERDAFLAHFAPPEGDNPVSAFSPQSLLEPQPIVGNQLLAFCVMGGVFGEGIDLPGDALIGTAIVGVGLPQIGPEPDALRAYFDSQSWEDQSAEGSTGFDYAYQYPGMNKVMQAAGRVIRTAEDRGVVLLIDSRFSSLRYQHLFPRHWRHWQRVIPENAAEKLSVFWDEDPRSS